MTKIEKMIFFIVMGVAVIFTSKPILAQATLEDIKFNDIVISADDHFMAMRSGPKLTVKNLWAEGTPVIYEEENDFIKSSLPRFDDSGNQLILKTMGPERIIALDETHTSKTLSDGEFYGDSCAAKDLLLTFHGSSLHIRKNTTGEEIQQLTIDFQGNPIKLIRLQSHCQSAIAIAEGLNMMALIDLDTRQVAKITKHGEEAISHIDISPRGDRFLAHFKTGAIHLYDGNLNLVSPLDIGFVWMSENRVLFSPNGMYLAYYSPGNYSSSVRIRDVYANTEVGQVSHPDVIWSFGWLKDSKGIVTGSRDQSSKVFLFLQGQREIFRTNNGYVWSVAISPNGSEIALGDYSGRVTLINSKTFQIKNFHGGFNSGNPPGQLLKYSPGGRYLIISEKYKGAKVVPLL